MNLDKTNADKLDTIFQVSKIFLQKNYPFTQSRNLRSIYITINWQVCLFVHSIPSKYSFQKPHLLLSGLDSYPKTV